ncbi:MAG: protein-disulfide reductase DsbD family protein, partial [Terracidiphilus sp.]|nr:protein-disulfide reductase DsbD family protein [Terracidiphilus sp.]
MRLLTSIAALPFVLAAALPTRAVSSSADAPHVHVQLLAPGAHLYRLEGGDVGLYFKLEPGWHVYWKNPGDAGEPPHIKWTLPNGVTAGPLQFPPPKRLPLGPLMDFGYEGEVLFPIDIHVAESVPLGPVVLHAKVDWLVCRESCIPGKAELEVTQDVRVQPAGGLRELSADSELWRRAWKPLPDSAPKALNATFQPVASGFRLSVDTGKRETQAEFFPSDPDILDNPAPQKLTPTAAGLLLDLKKDANLTANPPALKGVLELSGGRAYEIVALPSSAPNPAATNSTGASPTPPTATPSAPAPAAAVAASAPPTNSAATPPSAPHSSSLGLLQAAGLAFLGGLLLNLMPCVFPVLFLKGLSLVNSGNTERHKLRAHGLVYAAGILASFWALVAVLLGLRAAGATLGWGFQFQSPVFLELMAALLFFLGLSLAGQFEIGLTLTSAGGSLAQKQGLPGSFFTGVLAVVVATPCTAPFMGAALGYALAQNAAVTFAVFTALALGLAAPYVALTLQPAWTRLLPKPGAWMEVLRQAVAVPIFATVIWLAWVLGATYGASLLSALLSSFLLLAIAGWFLGRWPARRWSTAVAALILAGVIVLSAIAPGKLETASLGLTAEDVTTLASLPSVQSAQRGWQPWSAAAVSRAQAAGRPVLVDFTAKWCLSCQVNERVALDRPEV